MYRGKYIWTVRSPSALIRIFFQKVRFLLFFLPLFLADITPSFGQLDNSIFYERIRRPEPMLGNLYLGVSSLAYNKNNEYFESTATGYTFFGYNLRPELIYVPSKHALLRAGVFLQRDFGTEGYYKVQPTYSIQLNYDSLLFYFGNIRGPLEHRYIEPLYDFERVVTDNPEEGMQFLWHKKRFYFDGWVNWSTMIYDRSPFREEFTGGIVTTYKPIKTERFTWTLLGQWLATHVGGQIDDDSLPAKTVQNFAFGCNFTLRFPGAKAVQAIRSQNYLALYGSYDAEPLESPWTNGYGTMFNLTFVTHLNDFMITYWRGDQWVAWSGGDLYSSVSRNWKEPDALEPEREILIFRVLGKIKVGDELEISPRLEPYINLNNNFSGISFGLYVKYQHDFFLTRIAK